MDLHDTAWGATSQEALLELPGDELVGHARYRTTHAITIDVPAVAVWPWLAQLGQGRGGLYSYDWIENLIGLNIHSSNVIVPNLQGIAVGDTVRLVPEDMEPPLRFTVAQVQAPHLLVLGPPGTMAESLDAGLPYPCWTFLLVDEPGERSRLIVRFQCAFAPTLRGRLLYSVVLRPVHYVMERKMLHGIKRRAEAPV